MKRIYVPEAWRALRQRLRIGFKGFEKYPGNSRQVCEQIVKDCWNGKYFMTSCGHLSQFWVRDFGFCVDSLMKSGYKKEVKQTLNYAMNIFNENNKITTAITPNNLAYDFPCYAPDSLALFVRSLRIGNNIDIIKNNKNYKDFLNKEIKKYFELVVDKDTGLVKKHEKFSSMKDRYYRVSSCYDNVMSAMLKNELIKIKILNNPFKSYNFKKIIKDNFWTGDYFLDDLDSKHVAGDANVFPFWSDVFTNENMIKKSVNSVINNNLDKPFPLKYTNKVPKTKKHYTEIFFVPNSEGTSIWTQLGMMYIEVVGKIDKDLAKEYMNKYRKVIENYKNFIEIFSNQGKPYKNIFYHADTGMLWSSMFLGMV